MRGSDHTPSMAEWQQLLKSASNNRAGFLYYGLGRCLAHFGVAQLSGLSLEGLNSVLLLARAASDVSARRVAKLDNQKTAKQLELEGSLNTAILFTLAGCNSVVVNQWATSTHAIRRFAVGLFGSLKAGAPLGHAVHTARLGEAPGQGGGKKSRPGTAKGQGADLPALKQRVVNNPVLYGLPHILMK